MLSKNSPLFNLLVAATISSLGLPIIKWLIVHGGPFGISEPGAVSFCNVLFVGNICASILVLLFYNPKKIFAQIKQIEWKILGVIFLEALISAFSAMWFFIALEQLTVINVVLVQRLDGVFYAIVAITLFREKPSKFNLLSYLFIIVGIGVQIIIVNHEQYSRAMMLMILATVLYAIKPVLNKIVLQKVSAPCLMFTLKIIVATFFFIIALYVFGPHHFRDLVRGKLWIAMMIYAFFLVFIGGLFWYRGIKKASTLLVTNMKLLSPLLSILVAFLLLGERPGRYEIIAMIIVVIGALIGQIKIQSPETKMATGSPLRSESIDKTLIGGG